MPDIQNEILAELKAIRALLAGGARTAAPAAQPTQYATATTPDGPPPQPDTVIENAASICIHFGKNNGVALGALSERSLTWYATEQPARLDSNGKPYPPRPQEILLRNAARTLWHQQKGTLTTGTPPLPSAGAAPTVVDDSDVQF